MTDITGDFEQAVRESCKVLACGAGCCRRRWIRSCCGPSARTGARAVGEPNIPQPGRRIRRVYLEPAREAIGPTRCGLLAKPTSSCWGRGSFYTSVLPNLLVPGLADCHPRVAGAAHLRLQRDDAARRDRRLTRRITCAPCQRCARTTGRPRADQLESGAGRACIKPEWHVSARCS